MARYVLHARAFAGPLSAPTRNELRTAEADDPAELRPLAEELAGQGFRVWLFEHDHRPEVVRPEGAPVYRCVAEWRPPRP